jgi:hypothetical protein
MSKDELPPKAETNIQNGERIFRTALEAPNYLKFDNEAMARGIRPYALAKFLLTAYLNGRLVYVSELPDNIKKAVDQWQARELKQ